MDCRIIDTTTQPVLLYRDLDDEEVHCVMVKIYFPGVIWSQRHHYKFLDAGGIQRLIADFTEAKAQALIDNALNLIIQQQ